MPDSPRTDTVESDAPDAEFWRPPARPGQPPGFPPRPTEWGSPL
jgi:hypothetical protein